MPSAPRIHDTPQCRCHSINCVPVRTLQASEGVRDIMHRMLNPDPAQRITVAQIMAHPWFTTDLPAGVTELNETLLATAAAVEVDDYDAGCSLSPGVSSAAVKLCGQASNVTASPRTLHPAALACLFCGGI
jgi:serine/threonine protein kinase